MYIRQERKWVSMKGDPILHRALVSLNHVFETSCPRVKPADVPKIAFRTHGGHY
ncbi:hypothetical protein Syun_006594 [Stephania yunnanensis]|uniref:Uncharacterized protein n=1 Tax=Stephania yunnanensis TaxID=152371 RepID=A0AAP0PXR7_9MAGN